MASAPAVAEAVAITGFTPSSVVAGGAGFTLIIHGANFTQSSSVVWGEVALATTIESATELTAEVSAELISKSGDIRITINTDGKVAAAIFTVDPPQAVIATVAPASTDAHDEAASGNPSSLSPASAFAPSLSSAFVPSVSPAIVGFSGTNATTNSTRASTTLTSTTTTSDVVSTASVTPDSTISPPTITSLNPPSVLSNTNTFTLTVNGTNFISGFLGTVVRWNSTALATTYISSTQVTAVVPASLVPSNPTSISVVTAGGTSAGFPFAVNPAPPAPTAMNPSSIIAGFGNLALYVYGENFTSTSIVNWNGSPLTTTQVQGQVLLAEVPGSMVASAGTANVTVTNAGGTSPPRTFYIDSPPPQITSLSQTSVPAGSASFTLTLNGNNFTSNAGVFFDSIHIGSTFISSTQMTAQVPASMISSAGNTEIAVYVSGSGWSPVVYFDITPVPPVINSLSPASVKAGAAGFTLNIYGKVFTPTSTAYWGTTPLDTIYISPSQLQAFIIATMTQFPGSGSITVSSSAGTSAPVAFTINQAPPLISEIDPGVTTAGLGAFPLVVYGNYFTPTTVIQWGTTTMTTNYVSSTQLTTTIPAAYIAAAGQSGITVSNSTGTTYPVPFIINPAPRITTVTLPSATAGNDYSGPVSITGGTPGYTWLVTGLPVGMTYTNTFDSTMTITGTPASTGTITIQVSAQDNAGATAGPVTYNISVEAAANGSHDNRLNGSYACLFQSYIDNDGSRWATVANFSADGAGNLANGIFDTNSRDYGTASGIISGSFDIGADNNGQASIHTVLTNGAAGIMTTHWSIALSGNAQPAQQFRMVEDDDLGTTPSYLEAAANCYLTTASAFASSTISGSSFAFAMDGEDNSGNMKATAGRFTASNGKITGGYIDTALGGGTSAQSNAFTGSYTAPDPASGRFTISLKGAGNSTGYTVYIIDAERMFILDNTNNDGEQAGNLRVQQQASTSAATVDGPFVLYLRGAEFNSGGSTPSGFYANLFQGTGDGAGNITFHQSYINDNGVYTAGSLIGSLNALNFDSAHPGRATITTVGGTTYLYLFGSNSGFEMSVKQNGSLESGWLEAQTQTAFTDAALVGNYLFGELPQLNALSLGSVGVYDLTESGAISGAASTAGIEFLSWDQSLNTTYAWDATAPGTGSFFIANGVDGEASCAVITATKFVCASQTNPSPSIELLEQ